jgi:putative phosphoesterase
MAVRSLAALYDVHANLPALEAVLAEVEALAPDVIVVGGDVVSGPMPIETLDLLNAFGDRVRWVRGNADREAVEAFGTGKPSTAFSDVAERAAAWTAEQLTEAHRDLIARFEERVVLAVEGVGPVLFCHGSPRSDEEIITSVTSEERLAEILASVSEPTVVCGHTHQQFDLTVGAHRVVNAGSVGMPYEGEPGAFWLAIGPGIDLRRTAYDVTAAADAMRATGFPDVDEIMLRETLLEPADPAWVAEFFEARATGREPPPEPAT